MNESTHVSSRLSQRGKRLCNQKVDGLQRVADDPNGWWHSHHIQIQPSPLQGDTCQLDRNTCVNRVNIVRYTHSQILAFQLVFSQAAHKGRKGTPKSAEHLGQPWWPGAWQLKWLAHLAYEEFQVNESNMSAFRGLDRKRNSNGSWSSVAYSPVGPELNILRLLLLVDIYTVWLSQRKHQSKLRRGSCLSYLKLKLLGLCLNKVSLDFFSGIFI